MPFLSIIIPAYNEAARLPESLKKYRAWVRAQSFSCEVLVVDDGSTDATVHEVEKIMQQFPQLQLIKNAENKGKGGVVRQGMLATTGEWRVFLDADAATPIDEVDKLLKHIQQYEVIIGSRYLEKGSIKIQQSLKRRSFSRLVNLLVQGSLLPGIKDTQCGCKLFSAAAAERIFTKQQVGGWLFDVEILTIARALGYAIKEVAVDWYDAKNSKVRTLRTGWRTIKELIAINQRASRGAYLETIP